MGTAAEPRRIRWIIGIALALMLLSVIAAPRPDAQTDPAAEIDALDRQVVALHGEGKYAQAEALAREALALRETVLGPEHPAIATGLNNLAALAQEQGRYTEAEAAYRRALAIRAKTLDPEHPDTATSLHNLAWLSQTLGRFAEAEALYRRALTIREKVLEAGHPFTTSSINNLGTLLQAQGRAGEAEPLLRRALEMREATLGAAHPSVGTSLNNLGSLLQSQGRRAEAEPLYRRALAINERAFGPEHQYVAMNLNNLAGLLQALGRANEAEPFLRRALAINQATLGPTHPHSGTSLNNLANVLQDQGRYAEAEPLLRQAVAIHETMLGPEHPDTANDLSGLAELLSLQGRNLEAIVASLRAVEILATRYARPDSERGSGQASEHRGRRGRFVQLIGLIADSMPDPANLPASAVDEAFRAAQLAGGIETARAVSGMAARFAAGSDALAGAVRERQDLLERWRALDQAMIRATSLPPDRRDPLAEDSSRRELAAADARLLALDARIAAEFPRYADVALPRPLRIAELQALLADDEAVLAWVIGARGGFVFALRKDRAMLARIDVAAADLKEAVAVLRAGLEPPEGMHLLSDTPRFDVAAAHALYRRLMAPAETLIADARHVFAVPDGALQSLPLGVLVTQAPQAPIRDIAGYAEVPWLARRFAITVLPAVSSLRALRLFAERSRASAPFAGFGDPLFDGTPGSNRGVRLAALFRGSTADPSQIRQLARLPTTADELLAQASALNAPESAVRLRHLATEAAVKRADLRNVRVLSFATHGLIAGDLRGLAEPALALTPPTAASDEDDGLLTASEVAQLELNADWVVLSACNTAATDGSDGAEGLSGLAKAFFHAGARSLLVSHWPVESNAAVAITTGAFQALERDPGIGRSEALRRSLLAMMDRSKTESRNAHFGHPMFWAPFILVGEGAAGR